MAQRRATPGHHRRARWQALAVALSAALPACRLFEDGLDDGPMPGTDAALDAEASDARVPFDLPPYEVPRPTGPFALFGPPEDMGCSDGSREGFLDVSPRGWPDIAGCAGGWSVAGLTLEGARTRACAQGSGDTSRNPSGAGCAAADLCASGWHVCLGPAEVQRLSPSHCESALPYGVMGLFAVAGGGSQTGDCVLGLSQLNDVRGCGNLGQPEADGCFPLDRRLDFADCLETGGIWSCGEAEHYQREAERVRKTAASLGGVLCCRDER